MDTLTLSSTVRPLEEPHTALRYKACATRCLACRKSLNDAESVTLGLGPCCRKRLKITRKLLKKSAANDLVARAAVAAENNEPGVVLGYLKNLVTLDPAYEILANRVRKNLFPLRVTQDGEGFRVYAPYDPRFVEACRASGSFRWFPRPDAYRWVPAPMLNQVLDAMADVWPENSVLMPDDTIRELRRAA
jgi:hypothetical protein